MNDITIVTAFFDIGRGNWTPDKGLPHYLHRPNEVYLERFGHLSKLDNRVIVFTSEDFALSHPAGALGRKLLTQVKDLMHVNNLPTIDEHSTLNEALFSMTGGRLGMTVITNANNQVVGVFTDGDLRRSLARQLGLDTPISQVMSTNPKSVNPDMRASDALTLMNEQKINQLLIINDDKTLAGILTLHELLHAGVN